MEKNAPQTIHPKRVNPDLIGFMTPDAVYPDVVARMSYAPPGVYFLNVLNLIHTDNKFSFSAMDGDSFTDDDDGESHNCDC